MKESFSAYQYIAYLGRFCILGTKGELKWTGEWVSFLDTMLQLSVLRLPGRGLRLPTRIRSLRVDPSIHLEKAKEGTCEVKVDPKMDMVVTGGVELKGKGTNNYSNDNQVESKFQTTISGERWIHNLLIKHPLNSAR